MASLMANMPDLSASPKSAPTQAGIPPSSAIDGTKNFLGAMTASNTPQAKAQQDNEKEFIKTLGSKESKPKATA